MCEILKNMQFCDAVISSHYPWLVLGLWAGKFFGAPFSISMVTRWVLSCLQLPTVCGSNCTCKVTQGPLAPDGSLRLFEFGTSLEHRRCCCWPRPACSCPFLVMTPVLICSTLLFINSSGLDGSPALFEMSTDILVFYKIVSRATKDIRLHPTLTCQERGPLCSLSRANVEPMEEFPLH